MITMTEEEFEKLKTRNRIVNHFTHYSHRELSLEELNQIHTIIYGKSDSDSQHKVVE